MPFVHFMNSIFRHSSNQETRKQIHANIRELKSKNHVLLRLNNEMTSELDEMREQRVNLSLQLEYIKQSQNDIQWQLTRVLVSNIINDNRCVRACVTVLVCGHMLLFLQSVISWQRWHSTRNPVVSVPQMILYFCVDEFIFITVSLFSCRSLQHTGRPGSSIEMPW